MVGCRCAATFSGHAPLPQPQASSNPTPFERFTYAELLDHLYRVTMINAVRFDPNVADTQTRLCCISVYDALP